MSILNMLESALHPLPAGLRPGCTSLNKKYWELGSRENVKTWDKHLPEDVKIHIFSED